jgi:hypothetical protein
VHRKAVAILRLPQPLSFHRFFLSGRCVSAEPAAALAAFDAELERNTLLAAAPAFFDVFSFFAIVLHLQSVGSTTDMLREKIVEIG